MSGQRHALASFFPGKELQVLIEYEAGWAKDQSLERFGEGFNRTKIPRTPIM
jgi:hypothetical protein